MNSSRLRSFAKIMNPILRLLIGCFVAAFCAAASAGEFGDAPATMGPGSLHLATDPDFLLQFYNPALLGTEFRPTGHFSPFSDFVVEAWDDKLAIPFLNPDWQRLVSNGGDFVSPILNQSFDLKNKSPDQTSQILTDGLKNGITLCMKAQFSSLSVYARGFSLDVTTHMEQELHIPGAPFLILFSDNNGLQPGNTLDMSDFKENAILSTNVRFAFGHPYTLPPFITDFIHLRYAAWGVGASYIMGHALAQASFDTATITNSGVSNSFAMNGTANVIMAGSGLHGDWQSSRHTGDYRKRRRPGWRPSAL